MYLLTSKCPKTQDKVNLTIRPRMQVYITMGTQTMINLRNPLVLTTMNSFCHLSVKDIGQWHQWLTRNEWLIWFYVTTNLKTLMINSRL